MFEYWTNLIGEQVLKHCSLSRQVCSSVELPHEKRAIKRFRELPIMWPSIRLHHDSWAMNHGGLHQTFHERFEKPKLEIKIPKQFHSLNCFRINAQTKVLFEKSFCFTDSKVLLYFYFFLMAYPLLQTTWGASILSADLADSSDDRCETRSADGGLVEAYELLTTDVCREQYCSRWSLSIADRAGSSVVCFLNLLDWTSQNNMKLRPNAAFECTWKHKNYLSGPLV